MNVYWVLSDTMPRSGIQKKRRNHSLPPGTCSLLWLITHTPILACFSLNDLNVDFKCSNIHLNIHWFFKWRVLTLSGNETVATIIDKTFGWLHLHLCTWLGTFHNPFLLSPSWQSGVSLSILEGQQKYQGYSVCPKQRISGLLFGYWWSGGRKKQHGA